MSNYSDFITDCSGGSESPTYFDCGETLETAELVRLIDGVSGTEIKKVSVPYSLGSTHTFTTSEIDKPCAIYEPTANKTVVFYAYDSGNIGRVQVLTVTGESLSSGSMVVFNPSDTYHMSATFDSDTDKVIVAYYDSDATDGKCLVGTVVTDGISFGTEATFNTSETLYNTAIYDPNTSKVVIAYRDGGDNDYGKAVVGTVSGTTISFGTPVTFNAADTEHITGVLDTNTNKIILAYEDKGNGGFGTSIVGTVSGDTISFGSETAFSSDFTYAKAVFDSSLNKAVVVYKCITGPNYEGKAIVGTVSGTGISFGSEFIFYTNTSQFYNINACFDAAAEKVVITHNNYLQRGQIVVGTVSPSEDLITFEDSVPFGVANIASASPSFDSTAEKVVIAWDGVSVADGLSAVFTPSSAIANRADVVGVVQVSGTVGQSREVVLTGKISTAHAEQTPGEVAYIQPDGSYSSTVTSYPIGRYLSDTELLVTKAP